MNTRLLYPLLGLAVWADVTCVFAQSTAFTYQGRLTDNGAPANGRYDFRGALFASANGVLLVGATNTLPNVAVSNGLFTVPFDFGDAAFVGGGGRWLELAVRTNGSAGNFATLAPRQPITPAPLTFWANLAGAAYAAAPNAISSAALQNESVTSAKISSGQVVKSLNDLRDHVTLSAGLNLALKTNGNDLRIESTAVGGFSSPGFLARFSGATMLDSSVIFQTGNRAAVGAAVGAAVNSDSRLHVASLPGNRAIRIEGTDANGSGGQLLFGASGDAVSVSEYEDDRLHLKAQKVAGVGPGRLAVRVADVADATHAVTIENDSENTLRLIGPYAEFKHGARLNFGDGNHACLQEEADDVLRIHARRGTRVTGGNVGIGNTSPTNLLMVSNARCDGSCWINGSDRRLKQDFTPVDPQAVLEKVVALPVQQSSYQAQPNQKHLGPVAQDFHAAFGLGADDTTIATVDADGVALAAIQGLNEKLEQKETEIAKLKQRVERLEELLIQKLNGGGQ